MCFYLLLIVSRSFLNLIWKNDLLDHLLKFNWISLLIEKQQIKQTPIHFEDCNLNDYSLPLLKFSLFICQDGTSTINSNFTHKMTYLCLSHFQMAQNQRAPGCLYQFCDDRNVAKFPRSILCLKIITTLHRLHVNSISQKNGDTDYIKDLLRRKVPNILIIVVNTLLLLINRYTCEKYTT